jgi:hypothetical protein
MIAQLALYQSPLADTCQSPAPHTKELPDRPWRLSSLGVAQREVAEDRPDLHLRRDEGDEARAVSVVRAQARAEMTRGTSICWLTKWWGVWVGISFAVWVARASAVAVQYSPEASPAFASARPRGPKVRDAATEHQLSATRRRPHPLAADGSPRDGRVAVRRGYSTRMRTDWEARPPTARRAWKVWGPWRRGHRVA